MFIIPFLHKLFVEPKIKALALQCFLCPQITKLFPILKILLAYKHQHVCSNLYMKMNKKIQKHEDAHIYKIHTCYKKYLK